MSATNFNTKNDTLRKLLGNGLTYEIPRFQRDYSWTVEEWEDLWLDIQIVQDGSESAHYMGYLVLQSNDDKKFEVIDGQQRITTLSLIVLAVLHNLRRLIDQGVDIENNQKRAEQIRQTYIGYLDPVTLIPQSKLTLNRNNDNYFQTYLVPLERLPTRGFRSSEHLLRKSFEWFDRKIEHSISDSEEDPGKWLASFIEMVADRLFFTVITVTDELNAYKVFETLNSRGVRLSATDLLKNYLFSVLHRSGKGDHEMSNLEKRWEGIIGRLGSESFPDFLRIHWNSKNNFLRQSELFKTIRNKVDSPEKAFELVRSLEEDLDTFASLSQPETSEWSVRSKQAVRELRMFSVRQPFPLLLAAFRHFSPEDFEKTLIATVSFSFRYHVIGGLLPSDLEKLYNKVAKTISEGETANYNEAISQLQSLYPADDAFKSSFASKQLKTSQGRNKRIVRYILGKIEKKHFDHEIDADSDTYSLEHVLPQNPEAGWEQFDDSEHEAMIFRLGNMTLLSKTSNRELGNQTYSEKREAYRESNIELTKKLAEENEVWTAERISNFQNWMAKQAVSIWRVEALS